MERGKDQKTSIFINPSGFIEQHFIGEQSPDSILDALESLKKCAKKLESQKKQVLILEDLSEVVREDFLSPRMAPVRSAAINIMKSINFKKAAIYGSLPLQVIVNTLALISGKRNSIKVFHHRSEAIKWLLQATKSYEKKP